MRFRDNGQVGKAHHTNRTGTITASIGNIGSCNFPDRRGVQVHGGDALREPDLQIYCLFWSDIKF